MSEVLEEELIKQEGFVEGGLPYSDIGGTMTIGFGYTKYSLDGKNGRPHWSEYWNEEGTPTGKTMSKDEAKELMPRIKQIYSSQADSVLTSEDRTQEQVNALTNLIYRNGIGNVKNSGVIDAINSGDLEKAQEIIKNNPNLRKSGGKVLQEGDVGYKGITNRNNSIADSLNVIQEQIVEEVIPTNELSNNEQLFNALKAKKLYDGDYNNFTEQFSTPDTQNQLFKALKAKKQYDGDAGDFLDTFFPITDEREVETTTPEVKGETPQPDATVEVENTVSTGDDTSSVTPDDGTINPATGKKWTKEEAIAREKSKGKDGSGVGKTYIDAPDYKNWYSSKKSELDLAISNVAIDVPLSLEDIAGTVTELQLSQSPRIQELEARLKEIPSMSQEAVDILKEIENIKSVTTEARVKPKNKKHQNNLNIVQEHENKVMEITDRVLATGGDEEEVNKQIDFYEKNNPDQTRVNTADYEVKTINNALEEISTAREGDDYSAFDMEVDEATELNELVEQQIIEDLSIKDMGRAAEKNYTLEEKENVILSAKGKVLNSEYEKAEEIFNSAAVLDFKSKEENLIQRIEQMAGGVERDDDNNLLFKTQQDANTYNDLIKEYNALEVERENVNEVINAAQTRLQDISAELGYNAVDGVFANNFKTTAEYEEWRDKHIKERGFWGGTYDAVGTFVQEGVNIAADATIGTSVWLSGLMDNKFNEDDKYYNGHDMIQDWYKNYAKYNWTGVSDAGADILDEDGNYTINARSTSKTIAEMLPFTIGVILSASKGNIKPAKSLWNTVGPKFLTSGKGRQTLRMMDASYRMTVNDNFHEGKDLGLDDSKAYAYSNMKSFGTGLSQAIMPDINFLGSGSGKTILNGFVSNLKGATTKKAIGTATKNFTVNMVKELGEEETELFFGDIAKYSVGLAHSPDILDIRTQKETIAATLMLSGSLGTVGTVNDIKNAKRQVYEQYKSNGQDIINILDDNLKVAEGKLKRARTQKSKDNHQATIDQINDARNYGQSIINAINSAPENVSDDQIDLLIQKQNLVDQKQGKDKAISVGIDNQIKEIDEQISNSVIRQAERERTAKIKTTVKEAIDKGDLKGATTEMTSEEILNIEGVSEQAAKEHGLIALNPDGSFNIILNKDKKMVATEAHEFGHAVLYKTIGSDQNIQDRLGDALIEHVANVEGDMSILGQRLSAYGKVVDGEFIRDDNFGEEVMTIMSESIIDGSLKLEESLFTKIGDGIRRFFQKIAPNTSLGRIKLDTGKDVFNFVKDYSKNIKEGKIDKAILNVAKEGAKGKLVEGKATPEATVQMSKDASDNVQRIYEERGTAGVFDIIEEFKPIVSRITERRREAPNFDKELLMSEIEIGERGIIDLIRDYKPESGVPLAAYINKFLPARAIEASRRVLGEEFTEDITERVDIAAEEVEVEVKAKPKKKKIVLADRLGVKNKVDKAIKAKLPELDIENLNFKTLKDQTPEITGEMFGISPKKLISGANITKKELQSAQMFISKNADLLIRMLPEGATASGTATGVPQTLLKAFYTKTDRAKMAKTGTKAGLAIQVKNDIKKNDFLETFGIIDGKPVRTDRNTSARVLALANQTGKMMTNQAIREQLSENINEENAKSMLKLSDGKSAIMFSKSNAKENNIPNIVDYFGNKTEVEVANILNQHANLTDKQFKEQFPNEHGSVKNYIEDMTQFVADGGKEAMQFTKEMKGVNFGNNELNNYLKTGYWNLSDAKFKQDKKAIKWFENNAHDLASQILLPENATNGNMRIIMGFFAGHYNIVGSDMAKVGSTLKQGILNRLNKKSKSVLSKKTLDRWKNFDFENLKGSYASTFYTGLKKIYAANSLKEQKAIAKEYFTGKESATQKDFYDLWNTTLEEWLHSSEVGSKEFNSKADYILKLKKANAAIGTTGERIMAPGGYVYLPGSIMDGKVKFEHLKSSSQQSKESALLVINNKFKEFGDLATEEYIGIYGPLELFNAIDEATGRVNSSNIFRLAGNLEAAKSIYSIDNLSQSLYGEIVSTIGKDKVKLLEQAGNKEQVKKLDKAIMFSRTVNPAKGITVLDFDDTLATTKSGVRAKVPNIDGLPKPQRKVIFLAGGAGSGKGNVISKLGLKDQGFKIVNSDISLEWLKKNSGLPANMNDFTKEQRSKLGSLQHQARGIAKRKMMKYQGEGGGVVVDGTGGSIKSMENLVNEFKDKGYDVSMVFVETSLETALERNKARAERSLLDKIVTKNHEAVQGNKDGFKTMFGDRFMEVNTDKLSQEDAMPNKLVKKMDDFVSGYENRRLDAEEFANEGANILEQGGTFDFSEFNEVVEGQTAPLFEKAMKLQGKFGPKDMFVLTARPAEAAPHIHEFLKANGLNIPLENITGLANSTSEAKALWIADKVGEGYNDFYFADDALQNVQAVQNMLDQLDVKSKVQQARVDFVKGDPQVVKLVEESSKNDVKDVDRLTKPGTYNNIKFSKSHRAEYEKTISKYRPDLVKSKLVSKTVDSMFDFIDGLNVPDSKKRKYEQVTTKWLATSNVKLGEDSYKIQQAVELAEKHKEDIFSYRNPNEIIEKYAGKTKVNPTNPKNVKEFGEGRVFNKKHGITIHEVENTGEGQKAVRNVIDTHWGKDSNPWCITQVKDGKLTDDAWQNWTVYDKSKKYIVFQNGKLSSFHANDQYWDRMDNPTDAPVIQIKEGNVTKKVELVPVGDGKVSEFVMETRTVSKDKKTVTTEYHVTRDMGEDTVVEGDYKVEDRVNGITVKETEYRADGTKYSETTFKNGKAISSVTFTQDGMTRSINRYGTPFGDMSRHDVIMTKGDLLSHEMSDGGVDYYHGIVKMTNQVTGLEQVTEIGWKAKEGTFDLKDAIKTTDGKVRADLKKILEVDPDAKGIPSKKGYTPVTIMFSKSMNQNFNDILENVTGIDSEKRFSAIKARKRGADKGKFRFFIPPSHEDFVGLLYNFMGKGKEGNAHRDFWEKALVRPLNRAYRELNAAKQSIANDYKSLNKQFEDVKKKLTKKTPDGDFTYQDAIRVYLWNKHGHKIPGLSPTDQIKLSELVMEDAELQAYAETLNVISKQEAYVNPTQGWEAGDIRTDLDDATGRVGRADYFTEFNENAEIIFSQENLNKIEAAYGADVVSAIKDILYRTKTGRNRPSGQNKTTNAFMNYLNGSVAATMFFNIRSAVLQQMSLVNFINFGDNNILAAAKAFANQKQYWADWATIFNSDFMKQRRGGIKTDINGAELAASLRGAKNTPRALLAKLLELGFLPTQIGDNIAIATGGSTFYRNRINTYLKQGLTKAEAEAKAWTDFEILAEATQQSARPDMVSQQQASPLGKIILAFQNVTSQFNRLGKKAFLDIKNRRISPEYKNAKNPQLQSDMSNASRIAYYFAIQNVIFYTLQTALFSALFDDDEEDERMLAKKERVINGTMDSILRGSGVWGAVISTLKNMAIAYHKQREKDWNGDEASVLVEGLNVSPPLGIKARKIVNAERTLNYNKSVIEEMETFDIENPQWSANTSYIEALTNIPLNRLYNKTLNVRQSLNNQHDAYQRVLMFSGWSQWNLGIGDSEKIEEVKEVVKEKKKVESKKKAKIKREEKKKEVAKENIAKEDINKEKQEQEKKDGKKDIKCAAISKSGKRCKTTIESGSSYCTIHEKAEQRKDGKEIQCRKRKKNGKRCGMQTSSKSGYCYYHD